MKRKNYPALLVGLVLLGFLVVRCAEPLVPVIAFVSPSSSVPVVTGDDPASNPVTVDVEVAFPPAVNPCAGVTYPVQPSTLLVTLQKMDDWTVVQEWEVDASGWWNDTFDRIQGQITIGGTPDQSWAAYRLQVTISNDQGPATAAASIRVEKPIGQFTGGDYNVTVTGLSQTPANCVLPQVALGPVMEILRQQPPFQVTVPAGSAYPDWIVLPLPPPIGSIVVYASTDPVANDIVFDPTTIHGIDLGPYNIPGFNCLIGGTADGMIDGEVDPSDLDGTIRIYEMSVGLGSGAGGCNLNTPVSDCTLFVSIDGDLVE